MNRIQAFIDSFFSNRRVKWAVPTCLVFWAIANHFINQAVEVASGNELLPYIVKFEYLTAFFYLGGVIVMLIGIGRDVTFKNVLTFNLEEFRPDTNRMYQAGFWFNRLGAFSLTYIIVVLVMIGRSLPPLVWLLCIADFVGTAYFSFNMTRWIKQIGSAE